MVVSLPLLKIEGIMGNNKKKFVGKISKFSVVIGNNQKISALHQWGCKVPENRGRVSVSQNFSKRHKQEVKIREMSFPSRESREGNQRDKAGTAWF